MFITLHAANVENYCLIKSLHKQAIMQMIVKLEKVKRKVEVVKIIPQLVQETGRKNNNKQSYKPS